MHILSKPDIEGYLLIRWKIIYDYIVYLKNNNGIDTLYGNMLVDEILWDETLKIWRVTPLSLNDYENEYWKHSVEDFPIWKKARLQTSLSITRLPDLCLKDHDHMPKTKYAEILKYRWSRA